MKFYRVFSIISILSLSLCLCQAQANVAIYQKDVTLTTSQSACKKIVVFGAGYVGTVSGACFAKSGHSIIFVEPNLEKVALLNEGKSPILEPQLEELLNEGIRSGLIKAKSQVENELLDADIVMVAVPTPTTAEGALISEYLESALATIGQAVSNRSSPIIVAIRSTVPPNLIRAIARKSFGDNPNISLVMNPEFLRESTAINDFFHPPFCVVGGDDAEAVQTVLSLYENLTPKRVGVSLETACLLKYACNAFHALKISFANEMASICESIGTNPTELMKVFCMDNVLNCSQAYLKPGFSFGGSCLPKDLRALVSLGNSNGNTLPLLSSVIPSNQVRFQTKADEILKGNHNRLAFFGMSFKKDSDDLRDSPFLELIQFLHSKGVNLSVYDPDVRKEALTKSARFNEILPLMVDDLGTALQDCDGLVLCKDILPEQNLVQLRERNIPIYDLHYILLKKSK